MISSDLKTSSSDSQTTWKISEEESQSLEARTNAFTTTLIQTSDHAATQELSSSDIERSKSLIHLETKQKVNIEEISKDIEAHYYQQLLQAKRDDLVQEQIFYLDKLSDHYLKKQKWAQAAKLCSSYPRQEP